MRVGMTILPEYPADTTREIWARLEAYGFHHGWSFDHLGWDSLPDSPWYGTMPTLAIAAGATDRIEIGTLVSTPNTRHPLPLMRDLLSLDAISGGRFTAGLGAGPAKGYDIDVQGAVRPRDRAQRFTEFVEILDLLLREDHVSYSGEYYSCLDARTVPGCVQRPRLPFLIAGNGPRAARVAATYGQGWVTIGGIGATDLNQWWAWVATAVGHLDNALDLYRPGGRRAFRRVLQTDAAPELSIGSPALFEDFVGRAAQLGFTDVIAPWPRTQGPFAGSEKVIENISREVLPRWPSQCAAGVEGVTSAAPSDLPNRENR